MRILCLLLFLASLFSTSLAEEPVELDRFEKEILVSGSRDAIQFEVLPNGDLIFCEFWGHVKRYIAETGEVKTLGHIDTYAKGEVGLLGMAVAPDFLESGNLYALYCPAEKQGTMRVSRFPVKGDALQFDHEEILLDWPYDTEHVFHMGGAMCMDDDGLLYIGNGDNCHWNPGLPLDFREGKKSWDALRSAGNSKDHRGKILRIRPVPGKGYEIPDGNLFDDPEKGLPEIFAMGVRNPFRMDFDDTTGTLYFGDVGPNVLPEVGIEPFGYEEINATRHAGNFGWPLFIGPNEPYPIFDFEKNKPIETYKPTAPLNKSPNNTGLKKLPPATPALIWYSTIPSERFPTLGSGGRSIMAGPVYHYDESNPSETKLPKAFDGRLFIYEWMRNWIQTVELDTKGPNIEPFLPDLNLRRPIDMRIGPDGALYFIEYGDIWWENPDSQIVRVVYRRGNRPPRASFSASETAGKAPLTVTLDASGSVDPDGDDLKFTWTLVGQTTPISTDPILKHTFDEPGNHQVGLRVTDSSGASDFDLVDIAVGNARPEVRIENVVHGSFFDWEQEIPYGVVVDDPDSAAVDPNRIAVSGEFRPRRFHTDDLEAAGDPALALMRKSTCFSCHMADTPSAGPPYRAVAEKYAADPKAPDLLSQKIIGGGAGAWGDLPMPPHPQHTVDQAKSMIGWILGLADEEAAIPQAGPSGTWKAPKYKEGRADEGVLILTAEYTDLGAEGTGPLRGEAVAVLHSPKKKAAFYDQNHGMLLVENVEGEKGMLGHFENGDHILFRDLNLTGIEKAKIRAGGISGKPGRLEMRKDGPDGELLASVEVPVTGETEFPEIEVDLSKAADGLLDVCVVARFGKEESGKSIVALNWIEFGR